MSMLAERKRKQKWCINPRGNDWSEDSNKFGQKLLEKMGWSKGKGLGVNLDGITEHVKVSYKHDSKGMGFKEDQNPWTESEVGFASLLKNLQSHNEYNQQLGSDGASDNSEITDVLNMQSLENKSKLSRARVHYRKFTRGKDLSRYSAKDLAEIFGKSTLSNTLTSAATFRDSKSDEDQVTSTTNFGEVFEENISKDIEVCDIEMARRSKRLKIETVTSSDVNENISTTTTYEKPSKKSKKKNKRREMHVMNDLDEIPTPDSSQPESVLELGRTDYPSNTENINTSLPEAVVQLSNIQWKENNSKKEHCDGELPKAVVKLERIDDYYVESKKHRKHKRKDRNDSLKIKLKKKHVYDNPGLNINDSRTSINMENNNINEVKRKSKKKKDKKKETGIDNPALELSNSDESPAPKKKKRKRTFISYLNGDAENTLTLKSVPKKRKRSMIDSSAYDNPVFAQNSGGETTPNATHGIDNPAMELDTTNEMNNQRIIPDLTNTSTPKSALKKATTEIRPRKSVQINESINQEKIITDDSSETSRELDEDNVPIAERIEIYQIEVENTLNEKKCEKERDHTKKFKRAALKKLSQRRASVVFPGVEHEKIIHGYGNKNN